MLIQLQDKMVNNHLYQSSEYACDWIDKCNAEDSELWKDLTEPDDNICLQSQLPSTEVNPKINDEQIQEIEDKDGQMQRKSGTDIHGMGNKDGQLQTTESDGRQIQNMQG
jgi:hypothetical protein